MNTIVYVYHSCFAILAKQYSVLIDYYKDTDEDPLKGYVHDTLLKRSLPLYVLASHSHPDHFNREVLDWKEKKSDITYILSDDIRTRFGLPYSKVNFISKGETYKDNHIQVTAFGSTDVGVSFLIETKGKKRIFHAGDLNNWHWKDDSTLAEVEDAQTKYLDILADIRKSTTWVDVAMFPIDTRMGTDFDLGARQFVEKIHPNIFVPMHFWDNPDLTLQFEPYAKEHGVRFFLLKTPGSKFRF